MTNPIENIKIMNDLLDRIKSHPIDGYYISWSEGALFVVPQIRDGKIMYGGDYQIEIEVEFSAFGGKIAAHKRMLEMIEGAYNTIFAGDGDL